MHYTCLQKIANTCNAPSRSQSNNAAPEYFSLFCL